MGKKPDEPMMRMLYAIAAAVALFFSAGSEPDLGKPGVELMIRGHLERCEEAGLIIPVVEVLPEMFDELVAEVGWREIQGNSGHRRWLVFETPDPTRKSGHRYFRVEERPKVTAR